MWPFLATTGCKWVPCHTQRTFSIPPKPATQSRKDSQSREIVLKLIRVSATCLDSTAQTIFVVQRGTKPPFRGETELADPDSTSVLFTSVTQPLPQPLLELNENPFIPVSSVRKKAQL